MQSLTNWSARRFLNFGDSLAPSLRNRKSSAAIGSTAAGVTPDKSATLAVVPPPPSPAGSGNKTWRIITTIPRKLAEAEKTEAASNPADSFNAGSVRFQPNRARMDRITNAPGQEQLHWSISPEGKLIKSDNQAQWREAYQDQELQFRAVWTDSEGHEIWAGGSHLTLIHSWNGGVDWKKLKLGDTTGSGDITAISIDDGKVQVKTSNNQTWVSQDGGVTWVPLKSNQPSQPEPK